jgi:hypothetical protein
MTARRVRITPVAVGWLQVLVDVPHLGAAEIGHGPVLVAGKVVLDVVFVALDGRIAERLFLQMFVERLKKRDAGLPRLRSRIDAGLDLRHDRPRAVAGLAQADAVHAVDLHPHGPDVTTVPSHVALHRVGLGGSMTDDEEALHLRVAPDARAEFHVPDAGLCEVEDSHRLSLSQTPCGAPCGG